MSTASSAEANEIIIAGGGIAGLTTALSLHEVGIPCRVFESVDEVRPLGVGINLLPHAVRELDAMGLLDTLLDVAVQPETLAYFSKHGKTIWTEPRGRAAGYAWPQISIHRGVLQRVLFEAVCTRIGLDRVHLSQQLLTFEDGGSAVTANFRGRGSEQRVSVSGSALIACDGIHSAARKQLHPNEGMPKWNGALLWRGLVETAPLFDGRTQVWSGHPDQKFIAYPVGDLPNGLQQLNFIAELRFEDTELSEREDWNKPGVLADFLPSFESWVFKWANVPDLIRASPGTFVFPMVDRDPLERWTHGRMTLLGDAAHPMYPVGSNGASQAILDARTLAGCLRAAGADVYAALDRYDELRRPPTSAIVLANRGFGPELPMKLVEERAPEGFDDINTVISPDEILAVTEGYRTTAGFALARLSSPSAKSLIEQ